MAFEARRATADRLADLERRADLLLCASRNWPESDPYLIQRLNDTAWDLYFVGLHSKAVRCAREAVRIAQQRVDRSGAASAHRQPLTAERELLATALHALGVALDWRGMRMRRSSG